MVHATYETFLENHRNQLESSGIPSYFWATLFQKIIKQTFDAGNIFSLLQIDYEDDERDKYDPVWQLQIKVEEGVKHTDPHHIYLIDHAWTFRIEHARNQLLQIESLRERMATIMGIDSELNKNELCSKLLDEMWKYTNSYSIGSAENIEERLPVWYIMDEVGSAIQHNDKPNFRMVPFIYVNDQITYSLIFPIKDLLFGEVVCRDFIENIKEEQQRIAYALPWKEASLLDVDFNHLKQGPDYFLSGHIKESLPMLENFTEVLPKKNRYKVFTEYDIIKENLTDNRFEIIEDENEADILWYTKHFKQFKELSETPQKFINQFPFEYILTIKDLLCITCRRKQPKIHDTSTLETFPTWLPTTYNLKTELIQFVSYYQHRTEKGLDNHWIIKPFNLARGLDTHITNNLSYIMRLPSTGPKIAQKYIEKPVLFHRTEISGKVKFDVRYVLLLKSVKPLEAYIYRNFFLRFANKPFELNNFDEYEKHFTVMNYTEGAQLKHMLCADFKVHWAEQYPSISWDSVEESVFSMFKEMFECAIIESGPCGIAESPQSRALYAADIMLEWKEDGVVQPKLLEVNWTPDCKRACLYYKDFYNDIFKLLFLDECNNDMFKKL